MLGKFSAIIFSNIILGPFFLSSPSKIHAMQTFVHLMLSHKFLRLSSFLFCFLSSFHRLQDCSFSCFWCLPPGERGWSKRLVAGFLVGEPSTCALVGELGLIPLVFRNMSQGVFRGSCGLRKTLGNLSPDRWSCVPALLVVWPEVF